MIALSSLPPELILLVVQHAAWDEVELRPAWVAQLCLLGRTLRTLVTPILYYHIAISGYNITLIIQLAYKTPYPLSFTSSVTFHGDKLVKQALYTFGRLIRENFRTLARAMRNLCSFTSNSPYLLLLLDGYKQLSISSIFLTDTVLTASSPSFPVDISRCIRTATRLHVNVRLHDPLGFYPLPDAQSTQYLMIDVIALTVKSLATHQADFFQRLEETMGRLSSLIRVVLRARWTDRFTAGPFYEVTAAWATRTRDRRIWLNDSVVHPWTNEDNPTHDIQTLKDAYVGHDLWLMGQQLYHGSP